MASEKTEKGAHFFERVSRRKIVCSCGERFESVWKHEAHISEQEKGVPPEEGAP